MQATFLLTLETGSDTDLLGIAEEISHYIDDRFEVISCHPWSRDSTLQPSLPTQAAVPSTTKTKP